MDTPRHDFTILYLSQSCRSPGKMLHLPTNSNLHPGSRRPSYNDINDHWGLLCHHKKGIVSYYSWINRGFVEPWIVITITTIFFLKPGVLVQVWNLISPPEPRRHFMNILFICLVDDRLRGSTGTMYYFLKLQIPLEPLCEVRSSVVDYSRHHGTRHSLPSLSLRLLFSASSSRQMEGDKWFNDDVAELVCIWLMLFFSVRLWKDDFIQTRW